MDTVSGLLFVLLAAGAVIAGVGLWTMRSRRDAVAVLTIYLVLLFTLPSTLVVAPMGAVGSPALIVGLAAAAIWLAMKSVPDSGIDRSPNLVRWVLLAYAWVMLLSYALAHLRPLTELEASGSARAVITLGALLGVALLTLDGIDDEQRLQTLLRRLVILAGVMSIVGIIQFLFSWDPTVHLDVPGLEFNHEVTGIEDRSDFNRPWATANHPIEYSVLMAALIPLALHFAFYARTRRQAVLHWALVFIIAAGIAMSISRSGIVVAAAALGVMAFAWSPRRLLNVAAYTVAFTAFLWAMVPGLIGTLRSMFMWLDDDPSIVARRERVPAVMEYILERPLLGHGYGVTSIEEYMLLDNELYSTTIQVGLIGLAALIGLLLSGAAAAFMARRLTTDLEIRHLTHAIMASIVGFSISLYTFDAMAYRALTGTLFLLIGAAGALLRIQRSRRSRPAYVRHRSG